MFPDISGWQPSNARIKARFSGACAHLAKDHGNHFWTRELIRAYDAAKKRGIIRPTDEIDECTCTPLDGGLGAQTCQACKRTAGTNQIEF